MNLYWFLRTFVPSRDIEVVSPSQLLRRSNRRFETVFAGLPTSVSRDHLRGLSFNELVLFDYHDTPEVYGEDTDIEFLSTLTNRYFKPWIESTWSSDWNWGCLPLRRYTKLTNALRLQALVRRVVSDEFRHDVGFLGYPTAMTTVLAGGERTGIRQRIDWMHELIDGGYVDDDRFWGGLILNKAWRDALRDELAELSPVIFSQRRINFYRYFQELRSCRVVLTPAGNARWTYRHYEAVYAGATLVSTDIRNARFLVPLPSEQMIMVPDRKSLLPYLQAALDIDDDERSTRAAEAIGYLERSYRNGAFSKHRPLPYERFLAQLSEPNFFFATKAA